MPFDLEAFGGELQNAFRAAQQFKEMSAVLTEEEMMVRTFGTFIMRGYSLHFDHSRFPVPSKFFEAAIDGGDAEGGHHCLCLFLNLMGRHGALCFLQHAPDCGPLACRISHTKELWVDVD